MSIKHGGNIYRIARQKGLQPDDIIDFSANINPLGYSPRIKKILPRLNTALLNYPDPDAYAFIQALAAYHRLPPEYFLAGNGSTEFIYSLPAETGLKSVLIVTPAFTEYEQSYRHTKVRISFFQAREQHDFNLQQQLLCNELKKGYSALYLCNPANPTGMLVRPQTLLKIVDAARRHGTTVVLDEAFMDFTEDCSLKKHAARCDNLIILRSLTKFFGLPGLRIGYVIAHPEIIAKLSKKQGPWSVNAPAQLAAVESLQDGSFITKTRAYVKEARDVLMRDLKQIPCLSVFPGAANFLLLRINRPSMITAAEVYEQLLIKGMVIRTCEDFDGLDNRFFRIAVKKKSENKKLSIELKKILVK